MAVVDGVIERERERERERREREREREREQRQQRTSSYCSCAMASSSAGNQVAMSFVPCGVEAVSRRLRAACCTQS